jgi:hypothetical protein
MLDERLEDEVVVEVVLGLVNDQRVGKGPKNQW